MNDIEHAEMMREYKRNVDRSVREIEREKTKLQQQEKKVIADIKKAAKDGQMVQNIPLDPRSLTCFQLITSHNAGSLRNPALTCRCRRAR